MGKDIYPDFAATEEKKRIVCFLREWFAVNGPQAKAVIGISGGKDSAIAAALCVEALGKDRVVGVLLPNGVQADFDDALWVVKLLGIAYHVVNIEKTYQEMLAALQVGKWAQKKMMITVPLQQNLAPRLRMAALYAIAQGLQEGGRVINTCNRSEDYVGYSTKYGDSAGDVAPLAAYTVTEVLAIGDLLRLPPELVHKDPSDGLCGKTDEEKLGFTYAVLDEYILTGQCSDMASKMKIDKLHQQNLHKISPLPMVRR